MQESKKNIAQASDSFFSKSSAGLSELIGGFYDSDIVIIDGGIQDLRWSFPSHDMYTRLPTDFITNA